MLYLLCALLGAVLIAADQLLKAWVMANLPYGSGETLTLIPHVLGLSHVHNTGGAWSILNQHTWLLTLLSAAVVVVLLLLLLRKTVTHPFGVCSLSLVVAGAIGNLIDRIRLGYVVDMFQTLFINYPVFNLADICVVCGGIALCLYFAFFFEKWERKS